MQQEKRINLKVVHRRIVPHVMGLTLIELLVVVIILGILASISTVALRAFWQGQLLSANLTVIRNWLETTRRAALRGESCDISIVNGKASEGVTVISSSTSASGFNSSCNNPNSLQLESPTKNRTFLFNVSTDGSSLSSFSFTPRGTLFKTSSDPSFSNDIIISLSLSNSSGSSISDSYCLRLSPLMGSITQPSKSNC